MTVAFLLAAIGRHIQDVSRRWVQAEHQLGQSEMQINRVQPNHNLIPRVMPWTVASGQQPAPIKMHYTVVSPANLITGSEQEGVCGYLAVCRSLGIDQKVSIQLTGLASWPSLLTVTVGRDHNELNYRLLEIRGYTETWLSLGHWEWIHGLCSVMLKNLQSQGFHSCTRSISYTEVTAKYKPYHLNPTKPQFHNTPTCWFVLNLVISMLHFPVTPNNEISRFSAYQQNKSHSNPNQT